jgi:hypothetical protein
LLVSIKSFEPGEFALEWLWASRIAAKIAALPAAGTV